MRSPEPAPVLPLVLVLVLVLAPGCATVVLGPGAAGTSLLGAILDQRPQTAFGYGPDSGYSATAQETLARSLDRIARGLELGMTTEKKVYIPGFAGARLPEAGGRTEIFHFAASVAEHVVAIGGTVTLDRGEADFIVMPWVQALGGMTTHREVRYRYYPIYEHEEDHRRAWIAVFLYEPARGRVHVIQGERAWQVRVEAWVLGVFPVGEWFLGFRQ